MEQLDQIIALLAITMGVGWASGINLYATLLMLGIMANTGHMTLPANLEILADPLVMSAAGLMYMVEFTADKIPGIDTGWDSIHSFIRIPAGAVLAATVIGDASPAIELAAAIVGGGLAAATHATKAGGRILVNTSPEPFSNWFLSLGEDVAVFMGLWAAIQHPWVFLVLLATFLILLIWLLPKIWSGIKGIFRTIARFFSHRPAGSTQPVAPLIDKKGDGL
ncbi:MAG: DUF4126 domain-containing protein [Pseudomonadales bacterium]|nr:DUF4126 domain-containing protein [Pseudomonadales bacterium]